MVMVGQPKLTSEYIQASSRVSRRYPGVVFVIYDTARSRDKSHFEQFYSYHDSFYKYVEPTGITPFSKPARDRALAAMIIGLMRNLEKNLSDEKDAGKFDITEYSDTINFIKTNIINRVKQINERLPIEIEDDSIQQSKEIDEVFRIWDEWAKEYQDKLVYGKSLLVKSDKEKIRLMGVYGSNKDYAFETMTSMRNVDTELEGVVMIWENEYE